MTYARIDEVEAGTKLTADGGFTCIPEGEELTVQADKGGTLFVPCAEGAHCLEGQLDEGDQYIGLTVVRRGQNT